MKFFAYEIVADNYEQVQHLLGQPTLTMVEEEESPTIRNTSSSRRRDGVGGVGATGTTASGDDSSSLRQVILGM